MESYKDSLSRLLRRISPNLFTQPLAPTPWGDLGGALTGSLASIPQTLAFGLIIGGALGGSLSGVGVLVALYGSVILGLAAAILGGCPYLVAGPRASTLLVFAALIWQLSHSSALSHTPDPTLVALNLACVAVFLSGLLQMVLGGLRLGKLAQYVPFPVMSGFVNGSALLIILSQVWPATGIHEQESLWTFFTHLDEIKPATLLLALATAALVIFLPRMTKRAPSMLLAFIAGTATYYFLANLGFADALGGTIPPPPEHYNLHLIGNETFAILSGTSGLELIQPMLAAVLSMSILSSLDTLLATPATDEVTMRRSNVSRQLMAEGFGNTMAGMLGMAPGSGTLARTKAALGGGMRSALTPIDIALITLTAALTLGPTIGMLPQAVMAGLLIALGIDLIDKWTLTRLRRAFSRANRAATRSDMLEETVVVATALVAGLTTAVGVGILLSILLFVTQMARNPIRRSYRATALIPHIYGDIVRQRSIERYGRNISILELEGALFFGTVSELESHIEALVHEDVIHTVLDMRRVKHVDATGARTLERINTKLSKLGGMLAIGYIAGEHRHANTQTGADKAGQTASRSTWAKLADFGTISAIGRERFLGDIDAAVALCEKHLAEKSSVAIVTHELTTRSPLARCLNRHMLRHLRRCLTKVSYQPGDEIFSQGNDPNGAFFVASGRVEVMINVPGTERRRKVQSLAPGSVFGEMALIDSNPRSASIIALEQTRCYHLSSESFQHLKLNQPDAAFALLSAATLIFAERLRATNKMLAEMEA